MPLQAGYSNCLKILIPTERSDRASIHNKRKTSIFRFFSYLNMKVCRTIQEVKEEIRSLKSRGLSVGLVPTMGALHSGHADLFQIAHDHSDAVIVSIFVNPTQFGPNEDFDTYPRQLDKDLETCKNHNIDVVFAPEKNEMYSDQQLTIQINTLNQHMCGASRPGFFEGVLLVVNKLFNIIEPDIAVFGQKDIQQFQIIQQMNREFNHGIELIMAPIVRANDGLALSSRNAYLSKEERVVAPGLYRSLQYVQQRIIEGVHEPQLLLEHQNSELEAKGFKIDYLNIFLRTTLQPVKTLEREESYIIAGAASLGTTRLIDNILIEL